ncbi:MAG: hypothetical protein GY913_34375 [Proteobacteria bacterium]|nr:hypothetical protein [Pseudomonadota bacterium]MCP4922016.1 hypothetical protein [Pseudomonadota bacterium]
MSQLTERILIVDDGPIGALEELITAELPDTLVLVSSPRPRSQTLRRGVWVSRVPIAQMVPLDGLVHMRVTSDPTWTPEPICAEILHGLLPPTDCANSFFVVAQLLGLTVPATVQDEPTVRSWLKARRAMAEGRLEAARAHISSVTRTWSDWAPGWALADEIYTRLGAFEVAMACRRRSEEPPIRLAPHPTLLRKAS